MMGATFPKTSAWQKILVILHPFILIPQQVA